MKRLPANSFIRCLSGDLRYVICSYRFWGAIAGYTIISFGSLMDEIRMFSDASVCYLYMVYNYYPFWLLFLLFSVIPAGGSFCNDFENRYFRYRILRFGKKKYAISKVTSCFISAFLVVFLSQWLLLFMLSLKSPMYLAGDEEVMAGRIYFVLMNERQIWLYFLVRILIIAVGAGFFSVLALWISTKIVNIFATLAFPIIAYYLIDNLSVAFGVPFYLSLSKILRGAIEIKGGIVSSLLYAIGIFVGLAILFGIAFYFGCRKRCENG